jgi:hypothetical protein
MKIYRPFTAIGGLEEPLGRKCNRFHKGNP